MKLVTAHRLGVYIVKMVSAITVLTYVLCFIQTILGYSSYLPVIFHHVICLVQTILGYSSYLLVLFHHVLCFIQTILGYSSYLPVLFHHVLCLVQTILCYSSYLPVVLQSCSMFCTDYSVLFLLPPCCITVMFYVLYRLFWAIPLTSLLYSTMFYVLYRLFCAIPPTSLLYYSHVLCSVQTILGYSSYLPVLFHHVLCLVQTILCYSSYLPVVLQSCSMFCTDYSVLFLLPHCCITVMFYVLYRLFCDIPLTSLLYSIMFYVLYRLFCAIPLTSLLYYSHVLCSVQTILCYSSYLPVVLQSCFMFYTDYSGLFLLPPCCITVMFYVLYRLFCAIPLTSLLYSIMFYVLYRLFCAIPLTTLLCYSHVICFVQTFLGYSSYLPVVLQSCFMFYTDYSGLFLLPPCCITVMFYVLYRLFCAIPLTTLLYYSHVICFVQTFLGYSSYLPVVLQSCFMFYTDYSGLFLLPPCCITVMFYVLYRLFWAIPLTSLLYYSHVLCFVQTILGYSSYLPVVLQSCSMFCTDYSGLFLLPPCCITVMFYVLYRLFWAIPLTSLLYYSHVLCFVQTILGYSSYLPVIFHHVLCLVQTILGYSSYHPVMLQSCYMFCYTESSGFLL